MRRGLAALLLLAVAAPSPGCDDGALARADGDGGIDRGSETEAEAGADGGADADATGDASPGPWVRITFPGDGESVPNPVTLRWEAGGGVVTVGLEADGWPLQRDQLAAGLGLYEYSFTGVNFSRHVVLTGFDAAGTAVATDALDFTPTEEVCSIPDPGGFNHYTVAVINDWDRYPKDGTNPYCWAGSGDVCTEMWGMVHDGFYAGQFLFPGGGDCFCSGHTLEIFLQAYRLWQAANGVAEAVPFEVTGSVVSVDEVDGGPFYQHWQGYGVASDASAANAFESVGIGENLWSDRWDQALPGDFANISRSTGSGHAVIFVDWVREAGEIVGIRYYGCNTSGHSCPDSTDPLDTTGNSGPSFNIEYFDGHGGTVLPSYVYIGRVWEPTGAP